MSIVHPEREEEGLRPEHVKDRGDEALDDAPSDEQVVGGVHAFREEGALEEVGESVADCVSGVVVVVEAGAAGGFLVDVAAGGGIVGEGRADFAVYVDCEEVADGVGEGGAGGAG